MGSVAAVREAGAAQARAEAQAQAQVLAQLEELKAARQLTLLFITHDLSVLTYACEHLAVMYAGRIVEEAAAAARGSARTTSAARSGARAARPR